MDTWATSSVSPQLSSKGINAGELPQGEGWGEGEKSYNYNKKLKDSARYLRKNSTDVENTLWQLIRNRQILDCKFYRQRAIGNYIADFVCRELNLIIELDGGQHAEQKKYDQNRTQFLENNGYEVIRFWNNEVAENLEGVLETIYNKLLKKKEALTPTLSLREREQGGLVLDAERHKKLFPADLRPQAHEIIRTWAFYTIVKAHLHEDTIPWKNLMISGWCLASDKTKMSKSKGNVVTPVDLIEEKGSDVVRFWASTSRLGADTAYSEDVLKIGKKLVTKLWNATKFAAIHLDKLTQKPSTAKADFEAGIINEPLDMWILTRLNKTIKKATQEFDKYEYCNARTAAEDFFWNDFCDNYLELVKTRVYGEAEGTSIEGRQSAVHTIYHCLDGILRLFAPIIPHI
ncbi:MAG: DUF559 domain-containing protein, partial [Bacteroidetes bacterium]|nr:DUF559 domain-containing protein [Bacteroidota bacterium]